MLPSLSTHQSLLQRLAAGDDQVAWTDFTQRYQDLIRGFARRRGLQDADADDLLQDVWLELTRVLKGFTYDRTRGRFRGFLKTISSRAIGKRLRLRVGQPRAGTTDEATDEPADDPVLEAAWEAEWRQHHVRAAMAAIRHEFRASDVRAFEDLTQRGMAAADVAAQTGSTVAAVYQTKSRMLKRLRECIAAQVAEEG